MQERKLVLPIVSFSLLISTPSLKMTKQSDMAKILKSEELYLGKCTLSILQFYWILLLTP